MNDILKDKRFAKYLNDPRYRQIPKHERKVKIDKRFQSMFSDEKFNSWLSERFLKGDHDDSVCAGIFKVYQECVKKAMKQQNIDFKEVDKDVLGTDSEFKAPPSDNPS